jgi:hypothetical protein
MVKTPRSPGGLPLEVFNGFRSALAENRAQFFRDVPAGPFYGFNRAGAKVYQGVIDNWCRQGMMGGAKAHYDCIKAFSETDFTEDLQDLKVPVLIMHGDDDQIVPIAASALLSAKLVKEQHTEGLQGVPARYVHNSPRCDQSGPACLLQGVARRSPRSARGSPRRPGRDVPPRSGAHCVQGKKRIGMNTS